MKHIHIIIVQKMLIFTRNYTRNIKNHKPNKENTDEIYFLLNDNDEDKDVDLSTGRDVE